VNECGSLLERGGRRRYADLSRVVRRGWVLREGVPRRDEEPGDLRGVVSEEGVKSVKARLSPASDRPRFGPIWTPMVRWREFKMMS
jgi:hypothetical protein